MVFLEEFAFICIIGVYLIMGSCYERAVCEKGFANDKNQGETLMEMRTVLGFF